MSRAATLAIGALLTLAGAGPAVADDTEVFLSQAAARGVRPNVLLILDTSGSMGATVQLAKGPYDASRTYAGSCDPGRVYAARATQAGTQPPGCDAGTLYVPAAANTCLAAQRALAGIAGLWTGRIAQWSTPRLGWRELRSGADDPIECDADAGLHGETAASARRWTRNGDAGNWWTAQADEAASWNGSEVLTLYSANYLNWFNGPGEPAELSRLDIVKAVGTSLAYSIDGVNLGLMRYNRGPDWAPGAEDGNSEGGMIVQPVTDIAVSRETVAERLQSYTIAGWTPLSETLYEAGQYLAGRAVDYGLDSDVAEGQPFPSVPESRRPDDPAVYRSPVEFSCQKNYVVLLTDGIPTTDVSADARIAALPGFSALGRGTCDGEAGDGRCLDDMAEYLNAAADLRPDLPGRQSAQTYMIGFGTDVGNAAFLDETARRGGGRAFAANDVTGLTQVLQSIFGEALRTGGTFASPSVSVNAFNRTQSNNELFVSVFRPDTAVRWLGNVKKYGIRGGRIVDATGDEAVDASTGFLREGSRSLWSDGPEDDVITSGGAVSQLPGPAQRRLYTWSGSVAQRDLTASVNAFSVDNTAGLPDTALNLLAGGPTRAELIDWVRGIDRPDADVDGDRDETIPQMGDPLHARPALVTYGGATASPDLGDAVVFVPTNDGFLHALDARTGRELWAFIPPQLTGRLVDLYANPGLVNRSYGLDADVRVLKFDANQDGIVDPAAGDRVWLFFGMRRGGRHYYSIDVTARERPRLRWSLGPDELPGIGETWAAPTIARMRVEGAAQNGENFVLVLGGGYDAAQENYSYAPDTSGNRIYVVDAQSGALLWFAGGPGAAGTPDLALPRMTNSIPGRVVALDTDGDQYADRLYAGDMGGRLWRFDVWNGRPRGQLITGGVLATLGAGELATPTIEDARRFYNAPDVALMQRRGADPYYNIAIGSGYRGHPLHTETRDRFYSIRDRNPFGRLTQRQYDEIVPLTDASFVDLTPDVGATPVPATASGWKLELRLNGGWSGEKVLADATTISGTVLFTTYQPQAAAAADPCVPAAGVNRTYALKADTGRPAVDFNEDAVLDARDLSAELAQTGIAGEVNFVLESTAGLPTPPQPDDGTDPLGRRGFCVVGVEVLRRCVVPGGVVRTYWQRSAGNGTE
jgi:type IV pilus assembly protein PilY1